ncbi:hypothetical protein [Aminobacter sp. HY435]|uniref:hypothetical protein n=1 Tax=Aminobacter sp. HY435 TaxID=2970917 RepID=UPI0022B9B0D1|nr:hypothetical protein [Aminobacter sp. HY435]
MISSNIKPSMSRWKSIFKRRQKVIAVFSFRFDAHLVPDLLANIDPIVDGWIAYDDRLSTGVFSNEVERRRALIGAARNAGADWILAVDPDERFEGSVSSQISELTSRKGRIAWGFNFRELYAPDSYRIDGIWGAKIRYCLFRAFNPSERTDTGLHDLWYPRNAGFKEMRCGLNLYHLKMIDPGRRAARRDLYSFLDPDRRDQPIGYDYLADETGVRLEPIPQDRQYHPPHMDDGGLWMFDLGAGAQASEGRPGQS